MKFLLDTNACIAFLTARSATLKDRLQRTAAADVALCSVVKAEFLFGARKSQRVEHNLASLASFFAPFATVAFDDPAAEAYGRVRADLEMKGTPIGPNDLLIASIAVARGLTIVTRNTAEFGRVEGATVENWEHP